MQHDVHLVLTKHVAKQLGLRPAVLLSWARRGLNGAPPLIQLSPRSFAFRRDAAEAWMAELAKSTNNNP